MKLLFRQKIFSWFDSYDIYDENGYPVYTVRGELAWGHCFRIYNTNNENVGCVKEKILTLLPRFEIYFGRDEEYIGSINREFSLFKPRYNIDFNGWHIEGDFWGWDYQIVDEFGNLVASVTKELFRLTDTYVIDVVYPRDATFVLMFVLAMDAEKCSQQNV